MPETEKIPDKISSLFKKYLNGTCSHPEAQEVVGLWEDVRNDCDFKNEASSQWHALNSGQRNDLIPMENKVLLNQILDRLHHRIRLNEEVTSGKLSLNRKVFTLFTKVAAVLILPLLIYSVYLTSRITRTIPEDASKMVWQTVKTTVGMQTDFLLPDGSHVWLNSGSVIKYPVSFAQNMRQVELTGEAYFDVVKDAAHPFMVNAGKMNIEVKGTRFDVINYPDETLIELILESGSVRLFSRDCKNNKTITNIKPGERAVLDLTENKLTVRKVNVDEYTAWKEGMLIFRDERMDEVVRKLDRWFNVEIILQSQELKEYVYTATYRDETLPQILELLKISAPISYRITDRKRLDDNSYSKRKVLITKLK